MNFSEIGLNKEIIQSVTDLGFEIPTEIQAKVIPEILSSERDVIGLAQTGTGKTAAFGLPVIHQVDLSNPNVQALVLCPTRELCLQISRDLKKYTKHTKDFKTVAVYGGSSIDVQIKGLKANPQVVVGTPGRTLDLIKRKQLKVKNIRWLVLDEADEMLSMGFRDDLESILSGTPANRQTLLFSATMPDEVRRITKEYMNNPVEIVSGAKNSGADNVRHEVYTVRAADRYLALKRLLDNNPNIYGIVFCRTRAETGDVAAKLMNDGYSADALHGDLSQAQRDKVMDSFRKQHIQMLVATDVAARGLDINNLTHVLNYNLPDDPEIYIHRSGRTGRAGKQGVSMIISHSREGRRIANIEKLVSQKFHKMQVPTGDEIVEKRLYTLMDNIENIIVDEEQIAPYWDKIKKKLDWLDRDDLLKRVVYVEFNRFLDYYKNSKDLNEVFEKQQGKDRKTSKKNNRQDNYSNKAFTRFFINIGEKQNIKAHNLIGLINEKTKSRDIEIGRIDLMRNFSFFEADSEFTEQILKGFKNANYGSVKLNVEVSKPETRKSKSDDDFSRKKKTKKRKGGKPKRR